VIDYLTGFQRLLMIAASVGQLYFNRCVNPFWKVVSVINLSMRSLV